MKKFASRMLALLLVLSVLLMPMSALAAERNAAALTVGNFKLTAGEQTIALPVYLKIGGGVDIEDVRGYISAALSTASQPAFSAVAALEDNQIKGYLNGMSYGLSIPVEQAVSALESAMGVSFEDLIAEAMSEAQNSLSPEMQAAIEKLIATIPAMMDEAVSMQSVSMSDLSAYYADVLGADVEVIGEAETTTIYDVEVQAVPMTVTADNLTVAEMMDNLGTVYPATGAYLDACFELLQQALTESGEDEITVEQLLSSISYTVNGTLKQAENGCLAELTMTMTVTDGDNSESIEMPFTIIYLNDEFGWYTTTVLDMDVDGEKVSAVLYTDNYNTAENVNCINYDITTAIGDAEEPDTILDISFAIESSEVEGTYYMLDVAFEDYGMPINFSGSYHAFPAQLTTEADSFDGELKLYLNDGYDEFDLSLLTNLTLTTIPEGELLTFSKAINPLEASEADLQQLGTDAMTVVYQGLGILMSDPDIAALINNFSGMFN